MRSLGKNALYNVVYSVANLIFPLVMSVYASRILLPEGIGRVSYAMNIASYFVALASMGIQSYGIREIAKKRDLAKEKNQLFSEIFFLNLVFSLCSFVIYMTFIMLNPGFEEQRVLHLCCGLSVIFNCINIDWLYAGQEEYGYIVCRSLIIKSISFLALIACVHTADDYVIYALISCLGTGGNYLFNIIHARKYVCIVLSGLNFRRHAVPIFVLGMNVILSGLYSKVDITMLGLLSTERATGLYYNAHKIIDIIIMACVAATQVFLPRLSYYYNCDKQRFRETISLGIEVISIFAFPAFIGILILAPEAVHILYGDVFDAASITVRIFSVLILVKGFGDLLGFQAAMATGNENKRIFASAIGGIANIILNAILIPIFAQNGAAIASVISEICVAGFLVIVMSRLVGYLIPKKTIVQALLASAMMGGIVAFCQVILKKPSIRCFGSVLIGFAVYFMILLFMKNHIVTVIIQKILKRENAT